MIEYLPELINAGVESFKIEGRVKTAYYVASVVKAYREAIDDYYGDIEKYRAKKPYYLEELEKSSHRRYGTGFYFGKPSGDGQIYGESSYLKSRDFIGVVLDYDKASGIATVEQRNKFSVGREIEFLCAGRENFSQPLIEMTDEDGLPLTCAPHARQHVKIRAARPVRKMDMLRAAPENETEKKSETESEAPRA
jgi:putative protease